MPDELLDVLDEEGHPTGERKPKPDVHRDGDLHRSSHVWLLSPDGRLVMQRRSATKITWPGLWDVSCAGHVSAGESAVDAAIRETREELGLELAPGDLQHIATLRQQAVFAAGRWLENEIHEVFVVRRPIDLAALRLDPAEVEAVALFDVADLDREDVVPHPDQYAAIRRFLAGRTG